MLWLKKTKTLINFELVQLICPRYISVTDRQTDGRTTYDSNTALAASASRGKSYAACGHLREFFSHVRIV